MKYILLLLALLIIAQVATRQLDVTAQDATVETSEGQPPNVPTRPQDLQQFSNDMDQFTQDSAARRRQEIDERAR